MTPGQQDKLLHDLVSDFARLGALIGIPPDALPARFRRAEGDWLELYWREAGDGDDEAGWYLALMRNEAGQDWELSEVLADTPDYLSYVLFEDHTGKIARTQTDALGLSGDERRLTWFRRQEELLAAINPSWAQKVAEDHRRALYAK